MANPCETLLKRKMGSAFQATMEDSETCLQMYVSFAKWEMMEKTIFRSHVRMHLDPHSSRIYVSCNIPLTSHNSCTQVGFTLVGETDNLSWSHIVPTKIMSDIHVFWNQCTQPSKVPKHVLLLYVSLDTGEIYVGRFSSNNERLPNISHGLTWVWIHGQSL